MWMENRTLRSEQATLIAQEKERMQEDLQMLSDQYDEQLEKMSAGEHQLTFLTDSLLLQLESDKKQIERLQRELKQEKSTNTKRIQELTQEINTLRSLLRSYIEQIDSLHVVNQRLTEENVQIRQELTVANTRTSDLSRQAATLTDKVQRAAVLHAKGVTVTPLDKRGRKTKSIGKMTNISVHFVVPQNVTAEVGNKTFYIRILNPNDQALSGGQTFSFEGQSLTASAQKTIEYTGEETEITIYKPITETLLSGAYRVDIFADGHLIGKQNFEL